jgi:RNA polymerase sigma factor (sigma-70 family)
MSEQTDAELVMAAQIGDKDAFGQLVRRYQLMAIGVSMRMVADADIARELAQEAMLQAYLSLDDLHDTSRFRSWLYGIVLNVCRNYLRAKQTSLSLGAAGGLRADGQALASHEPAPHEVVQQRELQALIREQIDNLSPKNRAATLLFYYGQLSLDEIAGVLGISISAVKSRLHKSRKLLKAQLAPLLAEEHMVVAEMERKPSMIKVTAVHAVKSAATENYMLMLVDQPGRRVLSIGIGPQEGGQILLHLRHFPTARPMTYQLMANLLATSGVDLREVRIDALKDDVFHATVLTQGRGGEHEIDARPSDAVALALHAGSPIYVSGEVMVRAGRELSQAFDQEAWQKISPSDEELRKLYGVVHPEPLDIEAELSRFTKRAQTAWQQAQVEAMRLNHNYVGTEHLLLGMVRDAESLAAQVLGEMGVHSDRVDDATEHLIGRGLQPQPHEPALSEPAIVPRLREVVHLADEERRVLGHRFIGTEHLLLGLVGEGKGAAATILRVLDVNLNQVRNQIIDYVTRTGSGTGW